MKESQIDKYLQNIQLIPDKTNWKIVEQKMFIEGNAQKLKMSLEDFKQFSLLVSKQDPEIKKKLNDLFKIEDISEYGYYSSWENRIFKQNMLYLSLVQLSNIERNIRIAENLILTHQSDLQDANLKESTENILE